MRAGAAGALLALTLTTAAQAAVVLPFSRTLDFGQAVVGAGQTISRYLVRVGSGAPARSTILNIR